MTDQRRAIPRPLPFTTLSAGEAFEVIASDTGRTVAAGFDSRRKANGVAQKLNRQARENGLIQAIQAR